MNASLYVAKADGDREMLDDIGMEMAREVFAKMDWESELAVVQAAEAAGKEVFIPEFGLTDAAERMLVITPVDSGTVSFYMQYPDRVSGLESYPKGEVAHLIGLYFEGFDDDIAALIAKPVPVREVPVRELSDAEFRATITKPMRRLGEEETYRQVHLRDYLAACIIKHSLPVTLNTIELTDIYLAADKKHSHIHFSYGDPATGLVIVAQHDPDKGDSVFGHHFLSTAEDSYSS
jgi:hypothetical protein